jgi:hypothetical protein
MADAGAYEYEKHLRRYGIRFLFDKDKDKKYLCIAIKHDRLSDILKNTMYAGNYKNVLERDLSFCDVRQLRFAGHNKQAILLDWQSIKEKYFDEE